MEIDKIIPITALIITVLGWFVLHRFNKAKERDNKKRDLIISYLIEAWEKLEYAAHRENYDRVEYLEKPIAKVQMFGTKEQIKLAQDFTSEIAKNKEASLTNLLVALRRHLRKELKMEPVPETIKHLRFNEEN